MKANASGPSLMEIEQGIGNLTMIKLIESDKMGEGANAPVYKYSLKNHQIAVKCYQNQWQA